MKRARSEIEPSSTPNSGGDGGVIPTVTKVSRKVHACTECQARKIKCDLEPPTRAICTRCSRKGLRCVVNKSLQSLLEEGAGWKVSMEENSQCLQTAVSEILRVLKLPPLDSFAPQSAPNRVLTPEAVGAGLYTSKESGSGKAATMAMTRENSQEPESRRMNDNIVLAPMGTLYEVTKLRNLRSDPHGTRRTATMSHDFICRGKVTEGEAEELYQIFRRSLNQYLWGGIALVHDNLVSIRQSSRILLAAILTVTALHIPGREKTFDACYAELIALVSESMFERYHALDDIRGLCIGAFWLSDVSWKLSGHAVRIATELNLHQSFSRVMRGHAEHFEGARLWYFLYVCDHHFSIGYGRPPVIHDDGPIVHHKKFLELPGISQADLRLHSQVSIFIILTQVYNAFGLDIEEMLLESDLARLREFNLALDRWGLEWHPRLMPNEFVSSYPSKGVVLHQNFGKLQVSSLSLRGIRQHTSCKVTRDRRELANTAINCAMNILQLVLDDVDVRNSVIGVPIYLHTMLTYSSAFLLKVQQKWKEFKLGTDSVLIHDLVTRTIRLLRETRAGERHLASHMAAGLAKMLDRFTTWQTQEQLEAVGNEPKLQHEATASHTLMSPYQSRFPLDGEGAGNYTTFGLYDNSAPLLDENYFPLGFFDVMSSSQFDMGPWNRDF